jgi:hypothetical protein
MVSPMRKWRVGAFMLDCGKSVVRVMLEVGVEMERCYSCEELVTTRSRYHGQSTDGRREFTRAMVAGSGLGPMQIAGIHISVIARIIKINLFTPQDVC